MILQRNLTWPHRRADRRLRVERRKVVAIVTPSEGLGPRSSGKRGAMMIEERKRCDNLACLCEVPAADSICAPFCDSPEARDAHETICHCGHEACEDVTQRQLHGEAGKESLS